MPTNLDTASAPQCRGPRRRRRSRRVLSCTHVSPRSAGIRPAAALAGVIAGAAVIYFLRLGSAPVNISSDEARFGVQAYSIVTTGRAVNGSRLPLFFNITNPL